MTQDQADAIALDIVKGEITKYEKPTFRVTTTVSFNLRPLIERCRKNYWGIFDNPKDPNTGRPKQWAPLTRILSDGAYKNSDTDSKDLQFRARPNAGATGRRWTHLIRGFMREWLDRNFYGQTIDQDRFKMIIDGTVVWKTYKTGKRGQVKIVRKTLELLNIFIDPLADSIQDAYRFTERSLLTKSQIRAMDWRNTEQVEAKERLAREKGVESVTMTDEYVDTYELWGQIPKRIITLNEQDDEEIEGHIIVSGLEAGVPLVHLIEENTNKDIEGNIIKPYEEAWYTKVPGRWYGVGIPESVIYLQEWLNLIVNMRLNRNTLAQLGLIKWRRRQGQDISQQMINSLVSNGVIAVDEPDDLTQLNINPADESSYRDEEVVKSYAQGVTSIFDINLGAPLPASTTATGAVTQDRNAKSAFVLVKEAWGQFQERWINRHVMQHVPDLMKQSKFVTLFGDMENIRDLREAAVAHLAMQKLEEIRNGGLSVPTEEEILAAMQEAERLFEKDGDLFMELVEDVVANGVYAKVFTSNETIDVGVTVRNLIDLSNLVPDQQVRNEFVAQALDLLNLPVPSSLNGPIKSPIQMDGLQMPQASGTLDNLMAPTDLVTQANTGEALKINGVTGQ